MKTVTCALLALFAAAQLPACAPQDEADEWAASEPADESANESAGIEASEEALLSGGLGYRCSEELCSCNPDANSSSMDTCYGMDKVCHAAGKTVTCTFPPGGPNECHCALVAPTPVRAVRAAPVGGARTAR